MRDAPDPNTPDWTFIVPRRPTGIIVVRGRPPADKAPPGEES